MQQADTKRKQFDDGYYGITRLSLAAIGARWQAQYISPLFDLDFTKDNQGEVANAHKVNHSAFFYADMWFTNIGPLTTANGQGIYVNYTYRIGDRVNNLNTLAAPTVGWLGSFQNMVGTSVTLPIVGNLTNNICRIKIQNERFFQVIVDYFFAVNLPVPIWAFRLVRGEH